MGQKSGQKTPNAQPAFANYGAAGAEHRTLGLCPSPNLTCYED
jgi:hypothetical protein